MKARLLFITVFTLLTFTATTRSDPPASPTENQSPRAETKSESSAPGPISIKYESAKWQKIIPDMGPDSPEISILRVDPKTGATQLLIRTIAPVHVPVHFHSANETHTIIKANQTFECHGQRETLTPGSFNYIPAKSHHQAWLPADSLVFITVDGPWDINWVNGPPTAKDLGEAAIADVMKK